MRDGTGRRWLVPAVLGVAVAVGFGIGSVLALTRGQASAVQPLHAQATWRAGARRAPDFRLRDQTGNVVSLASERGRVVLLTFLDSHCRQECPIEGRLLARTQQALGRVTGSELLVVSVDPWADTARSARAFAAKSRWRNWRWLLGTQSQLRPVWRRYAVGVLKTPKDIVHTAVVYVIDGSGFMRGAYLVPFSPQDVAADMRSLS